MANRRMFSGAVIGSARFLQMGQSARLLYYDLGMYADDEGIVEAFTVMRMTGASEDDLKLLAAKGFIIILNAELVTYICDWKKNNMIRSDRRQPSMYAKLLGQFRSGDLLPYLCAESAMSAVCADDDDQTAHACQPDDNQTAHDCQPNDNQSAHNCQPNDNQASPVCQPNDNQSAHACQPDDNQSAPVCQPNDNQLTTNCQPSIGKDRLGQESSGQEKHAQKRDAPLPRHRHGQYQNVLLTDDELTALQREFPQDWQQRIERLSEYIAGSGKRYKNFLAVIRAWAKTDRQRAAPETDPAQTAQPVYDLSGIF